MTSLKTTEWVNCRGGNAGVIGVDDKLYNLDSLIPFQPNLKKNILIICDITYMFKMSFFFLHTLYIHIFVQGIQKRDNFNQIPPSNYGSQI